MDGHAHGMSVEDGRYVESAWSASRVTPEKVNLRGDAAELVSNLTTYLLSFGNTEITEFKQEA